MSEHLLPSHSFTSSSHLSPTYPGGHRHSKVREPVALQVPPLEHGLGLHGPELHVFVPLRLLVRAD